MKGMKNWANATISICAQLKISMNVVKKKKKNPEVTGTAEQFLWGEKTWKHDAQTSEKKVNKTEFCVIIKRCWNTQRTKKVFGKMKNATASLKVSTPVNHTPTIINLAKRYIFSVKLQKQCRLFGFVLQIMYCFTGAGWNNTAARYLGYLERMSCSIITSWPKVHISE